MKLPGIIILFLLFSFMSEAQISDIKTDSLNRRISQATSTVEQAQLYVQILQHLYILSEGVFGDYPYKLDSLFQCCIHKLPINSKLKASLKADVDYYKGLSYIEEFPDSAKILLLRSLRMFRSTGDSSRLAFVYLDLCSAESALGDSMAFSNNYQSSKYYASYIREDLLKCLWNCNIGIVCYDFGLYADAANHYFEAIAITEKNKAPEIVLFRKDIYHNLGGVYSRIDDYPNAVKYLLKAIQLAKENKLSAQDHFLLLGDIYLKMKDYKSALSAFESAKNDDPIIKRLAMYYYSMATCYRKLGRIKDALGFANEAVKLMPITTNALRGATAMDELAACEFESGMLKEALRDGLLAFQTFNNAKNNRGCISSADLLSRIYKKMNDYEKAVEYSELKFYHQQLVERQQSTRQLAFGEFTRENEVEKAKREAEVNAQLERQRIIRYLLFAGLGILIFLAFLLYNRFRFKQRTAQQLESKNLEVQEALERAEQSEAFKARFLANMSHEIRTPLHGISGFTELLLDTSVNEKQRKWLSFIHDSTEKLGVVVNDILDLSKLEAGKINLLNIPFSIRSIAEEVEDSLSLKAESKQIGLLVDIADQLADKHLGDPTRIYQILMNLLGNAIKFTDHGYVSLQISATDAADSQKITFTIIDTGIGIEASKLGKIFDSYQQVHLDTDFKYGGTGLGLNIVRQLIELFEGTIEVKSELGKGTEFSFAVSLSIAHEENQKLPENGESDYYLQEITFLVADDNALNREIARETIYRYFENARILEAVNGAEVVRLVDASAEPDNAAINLILMDMLMPEMSRMEATRLIRSTFQDGRCEIPIIALSASALPEEIEEALESGMDGHLRKPFKGYELLQIISKILRLPGNVKLNPPGNEEGMGIDHASSVGIDFTFLEEFTEGDKQEMRDLVSKFIASYPVNLAKIEDAILLNDLKLAYKEIHNFRPQLQFIGLHSLALELGILENAIIENALTEMLVLQFATFKHLCISAIDALKMEVI